MTDIDLKKIKECAAALRKQSFIIPVTPAPRYDEVFEEGVRALNESEGEGEGEGEPESEKEKEVMKEIKHAILLELDEFTISINERTEMKTILNNYGFKEENINMYISSDANPVTCVLAIHEITSKLLWFSSAIKSVKMLRIAETTDLMPVVIQYSKGLPK